MSQAVNRDLVHLPLAERRLGAIFAQPKIVAVCCVVALSGAGWLYVGLQAAVGDGIGVICRPISDTAALGAAGIVAVGMMWAAMTLAMMLPSAAPMIFTYAEIADTAARKGEPVVSPLVIAAGYAAVWLGFAAIATIAQVLLSRASLAGGAQNGASALFSAAVFVTAGAYQFSALKHACLTQCRSPFLFYFAHWTTTPRGVFKLGLKQGLFCLGCCWAMMLVMLAAGVMNALWMAALGAVMTVEKLSSGRRLSQAIGIVAILIGTGFAVSALAQWFGPL